MIDTVSPLSSLNAVVAPDGLQTRRVVVLRTHLSRPPHAAGAVVVTGPLVLFERNVEEVRKLKLIGQSNM